MNIPPDTGVEIIRQEFPNVIGHPEWPLFDIDQFATVTNRPLPISCTSVLFHAVEGYPNIKHLQTAAAKDTADRLFSDSFLRMGYEYQLLIATNVVTDTLVHRHLELFVNARLRHYFDKSSIRSKVVIETPKGVGFAGVIKIVEKDFAKAFACLEAVSSSVLLLTLRPETNDEENLRAFFGFTRNQDHPSPLGVDWRLASQFFCGFGDILGRAGWDDAGKVYFVDMFSRSYL